jgi:hypothetical protein
MKTLLATVLLFSLILSGVAAIQLVTAGKAAAGPLGPCLEGRADLCS